MQTATISRIDMKTIFVENKPFLPSTAKPTAEMDLLPVVRLLSLIFFNNEEPQPDLPQCSNL